MAKHCNVCNEDYADDLAACPRCATAKKTQLAGRGEGRATQLVTRDDERDTRLAGKGEEHEPEATPSDSAVNLGSSPVEPAGDSGADLGEEVAEAAADEEPSAIDQGASPTDSSRQTTKPDQPSPSDSDVAMESLMEESSSGEPAVEEHAVSEAEVDDMLANMEETPSASSPQEGADIAEGEDAIAAEEEEPAEAAEAEEEKPAKAAKPRSNVPALAGATVLGILLGVGGTVGARALMGSDENEKAHVPLSVPQRAAQANAAPTFEMQAARVASGDWDEAKTAGIEQVQGTDPKELVALGEYRLFGTYLKTVGTKINPQDPALQQALNDLQKAAEQQDPNAIYDLALIKELAGQLTEARDEYAKAAQVFTNDPVQKQRFESAVLRVDLKAADKAAGGAGLPQREGAEDRAVLLALLLIGLQQPQAQPPQQPGQAPPQPQQAGQQPAADSKEAGSEFWDAANLARKGKFDDAIRAIDRARKLHDQLRFTRLRKAQNPLSDPTEEIFLRCCDELKMYWQLEKYLRDGGYLTDKNTPSQAVQALAQKAQESGTKIKELMDKCMSAQKNQEQAEAKATGLEKKLQTSETQNAKLADDLKAKEKTLKEGETNLTSAKKQMEKIKSDYDRHDATIKKICDELTQAKLLDANKKENVTAAVKKAIAVAKSNDPQGTLRRQRDEIARLSASLKERWQPEEMLSLWLLLLDENRNRSELAGQATKDAQRVLTDPRATGTQKGKAQVVLGLALRNTEQFKKAEAMLEAGRGAVDKGEWLDRADAALKEVSHPAAYFTSQARTLYDQGRMETALTVLDRAMKVLSAKEQGKLLAQRSLIELEAAQSKAKGALPPTEPLLIAARKDADAAVKSGAAEGHYAAGRIAEALGQVDAAIASYRAALEAHGDKLDSEGGRYRMALARVLLLPHEARSNPPAAPPKDAQKVGWGDRGRYPAKHFADGKSLALMLTLGLQAPLLPGDEAGQEEAEKLADEVLKAPPGTVPFNVLAQALAVKGRWGLALQTYVEGIRPMLPRAYGDGLAYLIHNDPRLKRPDSLRTPNPLEAEKHFAAGLNFYFDGEYANAEKEFLLTIENDSQDARFFYFLGLSRLELKRRRDAYADFTQGATLERLNRPASAAVDESLERIQGPARYIVNDYRHSPER